MGKHLVKISFACEHCGRRYKVDESKVGQTAKCRDCGKQIRVPVPGPEQETSPAGAEILRHQSRERDFEPPIGDESAIEEITAHIEQHLGPVDMVWHELISDLVHVDIHQVPPTDDRPFWTLVTTGMSDRPMTVPEGAEDYTYAEVMLCLPPDWKMSQQDFEDENNYWPIRLLKVLARLPHEYETWLGPGHTIPNGGEEDVPYADNTKFTCALILPPLALAPPEFAQLELDDRTINFYGVWPLYPSEVDFKLNKGLDGLLDKLERNAVTELIDVNRVNACAKSKWKFWK